MLGSCALAFVVPFELFLFSYAVLGPLHYLTEITWLHKRDYFTNGKYDFIWFVMMGILVFLFNFVFPDGNVSNFSIYLCFAGALGFILFKDMMYKIMFVVLACFAGSLIMHTQSFFFIFAVFLPTLIHVFVFTGLFILLGALKNRSVTGILSLVVFILCAVSFFVFFPQFSFYNVSNYAEKALTDSNFVMLNTSIIRLFKLGASTRQTVFASNIGLGIMRFIAFAYTYHYLNWFSKTSVIKWHKIPKKWLASVIIFWLLSVGLYAYNYYVGLVVLYILSMLHVFMEFPLNYRTVIGIKDEIKGYARGPKPVIAVKKLVRFKF